MLSIDMWVVVSIVVVQSNTDSSNSVRKLDVFVYAPFECEENK